LSDYILSYPITAFKSAVAFNCASEIFDDVREKAFAIPLSLLLIKKRCCALSKLALIPAFERALVKSLIVVSSVITNFVFLSPTAILISLFTKEASISYIFWEPLLILERTALVRYSEVAILLTASV